MFLVTCMVSSNRAAGIRAQWLSLHATASMNRTWACAWLRGLHTRSAHFQQWYKDQLRKFRVNTLGSRQIIYLGIKIPFMCHLWTRSQNFTWLITIVHDHDHPDISSNLIPTSGFYLQLSHPSPKCIQTLINILSVSMSHRRISCTNFFDVVALVFHCTQLYNAALTKKTLHLTSYTMLRNANISIYIYIKFTSS